MQSMYSSIPQTNNNSNNNNDNNNNKSEISSKNLIHWGSRGRSLSVPQEYERSHPPVLDEAFGKCEQPISHPYWGYNTGKESIP